MTAGIAAAAVADGYFDEILVAHDGFQFHGACGERVLSILTGAAIASMVKEFLVTCPDGLEHGRSCVF